MCNVDGHEFVLEDGQYIISKKALYGLKISGAEFRAHLSKTLSPMGYNPIYAYPDVYIRLELKPNGF